MTDTSPETVARMIWALKDWGEYDEGVINDRRESAADMLEALSAERDALSARLDVDAKAHEKEIAVWSENYAALERKVAEVEAERDQLEQDLADMRDNADSAFRRGYYAGRNGE
jgi:predicted RNase H-like nuclease (RuvC/YqgF family)